VRNEFRALAELRGRLLWRRFTARGGIAEGVASVVLVVIAVPVGLAFAVAIGYGAFQAVRAAGGLRTDVGASAIFFGIWQTWTAVSLTLNDRDGLDLRRFLVFPIRPGRVYAMGLLTGILGDPVGLVWGAMLGGVFVGAAIARPGAWLVLLLFLLLAFAVATVILVALIQEVLAAVLSTRRIREWAMIGSVGVSVGFLVLLLWSADRPVRAAGDALPLLRIVQWLAWPGAFPAAAARELFAGRVLASLPWIGGLLLATAVTGWLAFRIALLQARGAGSSGEGSTGGRPGQIGLGLRGGRFGALLEKEARYLYRQPLARVDALLAPVLMAFVALKVEPRIPIEAGEVVRALPLFGAAIYCHLLLQAFWLNAFGWERGGARALFLAPLDLSAVLRAKGLVLYAYSLTLFLVSAGVMAAVGKGTPPTWAFAGALVLHAATAPWLLAAGSLVSILRPKAASFAIQRSSALSTFSGLIGMGIVSATMGVFALPALLALRAESPALLVGGWVVLGIAGAAVLRAVLPREARLLADRRDEFLPAVCGDDV
jgi:ABC-2 type transport system permease protein